MLLWILNLCIWTFQHGPPHLTNLVVQGPPPAQSHSPAPGQLVQAPVTHVIQALPPTQIIHGPPPTQIVQGPPPGYQAPPPHLIHGPPLPGQIPAPYHIGPPPVVSEGVPVISQSSQPPPGSPVYSVHTSVSEEGRWVMSSLAYSWLLYVLHVVIIIGAISKRRAQTVVVVFIGPHQNRFWFLHYKDVYVTN